MTGAHSVSKREWDTPSYQPLVESTARRHSQWCEWSLADADVFLLALLCHVFDDKSHYCKVYLLHNKAEVAARFADIVVFAKRQTGKRVKTLQSDKGGNILRMNGQILQWPRNCTSLQSALHSSLRWGRRANEPNVGKTCALHDGTRWVILGEMGWSYYDGNVFPQSVPYTCCQSWQIAMPSLDWQEAIAG